MYNDFLVEYKLSGFYAQAKYLILRIFKQEFGLDDIQYIRNASVDLVTCFLKFGEEIYADH